MAGTLRLVFHGLEEFKRELANLPKHLHQEGGTIVRTHARSAQAQIFQKYPRGKTGNLRGGLRLLDQSTEGSTLMVLENRAPHAWIFEHGSEARKTKHGWDRGKMPPGHVFVPIVMRERRNMYLALAAMMRMNGLTVTLPYSMLSQVIREIASGEAA